MASEEGLSPGLFKRNRKANFTQEEVNALVDICATYKNVLFGRLSPNVPPLERENAWQEVQRVVNEVSTCGRTLQEIKIKWKQIKQVSRNKLAQQKLGVAHEDYAPQLDNRVLSIMEAILLEGNTESEHKEIRLIDDAFFTDSLQERLVQQQQNILGTPPPPATVTKAPPVAHTPPPPPALKQVAAKPAPAPKVVHPPPSVQITPQHVNVQYTPTVNQDLDKDPDEVCLRWNSHHSNMKNSFPSLLEKEQYVDVTLCSEGQTIRCHRLILSSCSAYFDEILSGITPIQHPVIFLKGTPFWILKSLIDFMYVGEVHIEQCKLQEILDVAEALKIKGLTGKNPHHNIKEEPRNDDSPPGRRHLPPLRLAVSKEQAANMQTIDPMSLLTPTFYEENVPHLGRKQPPSPKGKFQTLVPLSDKQREWLSKKLIPKRRLKRKSTDHEPSPPPVLLRKGTKSRPVVKAPKYYHNEYEENDGKMMKLEEDGEEDEHNTMDDFDIANVKSEPVDIEENDVTYDHFLSTGTIKFGNSITPMEENNYQPTDHPPMEENNYQPTDHPPNEEENDEKPQTPEQGQDSGEEDQAIEENNKEDEANDPLTINEEKMDDDFKDKDSGDDMDHQDDDDEYEINMGVEVDVNVDVEESDVNVDAND